MLRGDICSMANEKSHTVIEGINYCFSRCVEERSLEITYDMLKSMNLPEADINTVIFLFAATCAKHYKNGYKAGRNVCGKLNREELE